ncbi:MAG: hypothetical protein ABW170_09380 [Candidatus Thiodiazotropha sp. L084R]
MDERKSITELLALYSLEDTIKDIYVEGERDKQFISWFVGAEGGGRIGVYAIGDIDVSNKVLDKYNLPHGSNRSRVIAVANELSDGLPDCNNILFIADRDYEDYLPCMAESRFFAFTDYNSIESYIITEDAMRKIISIVYGLHSGHTPRFYYDLKEILRKIFSIRLANESLKWNMSWIEFNKYIKVRPILVFNEEKFIEAYLRKNSKWSKRAEFNTCLELCRKQLHDDCRLSIRGHDFSALLLHYLNKKCIRKKLDKVDLFEGFLLSSLERNDLLNEGMLKLVHEFSTGELHL